MPSITPNAKRPAQAARPQAGQCQINTLGEQMSSTTERSAAATVPATGTANLAKIDCLQGCIEHDGSTPSPDDACWTEHPAGWVPTSLNAEPVRLTAVGRHSDSGSVVAEVILFVGNPGDDAGDHHAEMSSKQARWLAARLLEAADLAESMVRP